MVFDSEKAFLALAPAAEFCSLRIVRRRDEQLRVRRGVVQPLDYRDDRGAMITVLDGGIGYAATPDLSPAGLRHALASAQHWARFGAGRSLVTAAHLDRDVHRGEYYQRARQPWAELPLSERLNLLRQESERLHCDERIVEWSAGFWHSEVESEFLTTDGTRVQQRFETLLPTLQATAHYQGETQRRSLGQDVNFHQGGLEVLETCGFLEAAPRISAEALELLTAPHCPEQVCDLLLAPDQMVLQIHESIGHPLELDRILGDERNYAGRSFVDPTMFGDYRYGSEHLNVSFDPEVPGEVSSYVYDDEGSPAERQYLIKDGILLRGIGGQLSQRRAGLPGIATSRACHWDRPPIDRMANLNLEPGSQSFAALVAGMEQGVYMETNSSWSIDDSRNKFQFSCERGRLIQDGELGPVVKNPGYRGTSREFWRSLDGVGDRASWRVLGVGYCGKGEPNQAVRVGHATPPCRFRGVAVFGGE